VATNLAHSYPTSCVQVSKIEALIVYCRPSDSRIAAFADAHFNTCLASLKILLDVKFMAYMEHKAGEFFQAYGFVTREGEEDKEAAATAAATAAEVAAAAAKAAEAQAAAGCRQPA
jgi:hypothetical protein